MAGVSAPPKKNTATDLYVALRSQADSTIFRVNPTIAAGDFKIIIDGGAAANCTNLPAVTPAGGKWVKIVLTAAEMNGDMIIVQCSDAAGAEWMDVGVTLNTSSRQIDDLAFPATSGRSSAIDPSGGQTVQPGTAAGQIDLTSGLVKVQQGTAAGQLDTSAGRVTVQAGVGAGQLDVTAGVINAALSAAEREALWNVLASAVATTNSIGLQLKTNIDTAISSRSTLGGTAQTGDSFARLGAPAGASVSVDLAAVKADSGNLIARLGAIAGSGVNTVLGFFKAALSKTASTPTDIGGTFDPATDAIQALRDNLAVPGSSMVLSAGERSSIADSLLARNIAGGSDGTRTVGHTMAAIRNKVSVDPSTGAFTIYDTDDTTPLWTGVASFAAASRNPLQTVDPA